MTFNFAPWAVDGARTTSALARSAAFAAGGGRSGITKPTHMRVLPLAVPGAGLRVTSGTATVLNGYQSDPSESYTVSNSGTHTVPSSSMPAPVAQTRYYLVCVVVGDPEFNQTGHPFMPSTPLDPQTAADFEYVRIVVLPCTSSTTRFEQLGFFYPGYALARLEVPPNTSTITSAMITDLRSLAQARSERRVFVGQPSEGSVAPLTPDWTSFGDFKPWVDVPEWATWVDVVTSMDGYSHLDPEAVGQFWADIGGVMSAAIYYEYEDSSRPGGERRSTRMGLSARIEHLAGQRVQMQMLVNRLSGPGTIQIYGGTTAIYDVQFSERPIL